MIINHEAHEEREGSKCKRVSRYLFHEFLRELRVLRGNAVLDSFGFEQGSTTKFTKSTKLKNKMELRNLSRDFLRELCALRGNAVLAEARH
jgi:hypothetical protein